jgi:hypothetical protein
MAMIDATARGARIDVVQRMLRGEKFGMALSIAPYMNRRV